MAYGYTPLKSSESDIRVARLQPGAFDDDLRISFQNGSLKELGPDYEALSYVWGPMEDPSHVEVEDNYLFIISIRRNLDIALRHLWWPHDVRIVWVDALCIDQQSNIEKSRQDSLMGEIYSSASCVLIWLGPEEYQSNDALALIKELSKEVEMVGNTYDYIPQPNVRMALGPTALALFHIKLAN
ncbi:Nn.00g042850.m01.CDS01 [Neocucurbitaria sp. VM-36]